jgi:hypothetical protein
MATEFCSCTGLGLGSFKDKNEIIVSIYGPRRGLAATQALSVEQAKLLRNQLNDAIAKLEG